MSSSFSYTEASTFTVTHARHMAAKVAADLKRIQRLYSPNGLTDQDIADYEAELIAMLKAGYLEKVTYGYQRNGDWIEPSLTYTAKDLMGGSANDDDPGKIRPNQDVSGASFTSYLTYSSTYLALGEAAKESFKSGLAVKRVTKPTPGVSGYLIDDRTYSAGGRALSRQTVRNY